jgi:hypothetical protein
MLIRFVLNRLMADAFTIIYKDQADDITQKTVVEEAKKQSKKLLMQMSPRDVCLPVA